MAGVLVGSVRVGVVNQLPLSLLGVTVRLGAIAGRLYKQLESSAFSRF